MSRDRSIPPPPPPTEAELRILAVLWRLGPSTVRDVNDELSAEKRTTYTTTLKFLQIMLGKKLVEREESSRSHVYRAAVSERVTKRQLAGDLLSRVFGGSAAALVQHALSVKPASRSELREVREIVRRLESGEGMSDE